jgi:starch-binding outer membrane protein, SusD/RagB family
MSTKIISIIILGVFLASCSKDFYDEKDPNKITSANFWQTEEDLNSAIWGVYWAATTTNGCYGEPMLLPELTRTEEFHSYDDDYGTFTNTSNRSDITTNWGIDYQGIFYANQILKYGGDMDISSNIKSKYLAEARFFRGLFYFHLVNAFGAVPIHISLPTTSEDYYIAKSPITDVWKQVVSDFSEAAADLPVSRSTNETGRVTKGAALAYLGRAYLYQGNWAKAQETLESIVNNNATIYKYELLDNYAYLFDGQHENNAEAIFEIQISLLGGDDNWNNEGATRTLASTLCQLYAGSEVGGWENPKVNPALLDTFLREKTTTNEFDQRATTTLAWNYIGCKYFQHDFSSFSDLSKVYIRKYTDWWNAAPNEKSGLDYYGMRYADVLLMLAEAYTMQENVSAAAPLVQQIRTRAKLADKETEMKSYLKDVMMVEIRHQRQVEFCLEWLHFYDLRRWGLLADAIAKSSNIYKGNYSKKFEYFPIPSAELSANKNMTQSEGW